MPKDVYDALMAAGAAGGDSKDASPSAVLETTVAPDMELQPSDPDAPEVPPEIASDDDAGTAESEGLRIIVGTQDSASFAGVFGPGNGAQKIVLSRSWDAFVADWQSYSQSGYRLIDLDSHATGGTRYFEGVFEPGNDAYYLWAASDWNGFASKWSELSAQGMRLIDLETYVDNGGRRYAGVFRGGNDGYALWAGAGFDNFVAKWRELSQAGLRLIDLEVYEENGGLKYTGVFRQGSGGYGLWIGASWIGFSAKAREFAAQGLRLVDMEAYTFGSKRLYAGVFRSGGETQEIVAATARGSFLQQANALASRGFRLRRVEHDQGDQPPARLAAAFVPLEQRAKGFTWAVIDNGTLISAGGNGWARDPWSVGVAANALTRMHLASISKSVTAIALMKALELTGKSVDEPFYPIIRTRFPHAATGVANITIRNLMQHRSGMAEQGGCGDGGFTAAMQALLDRPLARTPGDEQRYSNGNFCLVRTVIEALSGQDYEAFVQARVLAPLGITTMSCKPEPWLPARYYAPSSSLPGIDFGDFTGQCSAYGWYASAVDLARLLDGLRRNIVLTAASRYKMHHENLGFWPSTAGDVFLADHNGAWSDGSSRGFNGSIMYGENGRSSVLLVNTTGFDTSGILRAGMLP
ncbi:MAG: serine hydrolase [Deltaproteobacteria bacterium]|nr:serine hydrolase [Deltaproteobacteria bacterium]